MIAARILLAFCAAVSAGVIAYAAHMWASQLLFTTPYQMWPLAGTLMAYAYLFALAVIVGACFLIYKIWTA